MAHIVDDTENIGTFTAKYSEAMALFRDGRYGRPSKSASPESDSPALQPQPSPSPTMHPTDQASESGRTPPSAEMGQHPNASAIPPPQHDAEDLLGDASTSHPCNGSESSMVDSQALAQHLTNGAVLSNGTLDNAVEPTRFAINKHFASPHLGGLRAPPPTPESRAHVTPSSGLQQRGNHESETLEQELSNEELLISSVDKHLASKSSSPGLNESIHAPKRSRFAGDREFLRHGKQERELSPSSRHERDGSFERLSFVVSSEYKDALQSSIQADALTKKGVDHPTEMANEQLMEGENKASDRIPSHVDITETCTTAAEVRDEVPSLPAEACDNVSHPSASVPTEDPLMKGYQIGLQSFLAKYISQGKPASLRVEPAMSEETVFPTATDSSALASSTRTMTRTEVTTPNGDLDSVAVQPGTIALRPREISISDEGLPSTGEGEPSQSPLSPITAAAVKFEKLSPQTARHVLKPELASTPTGEIDDTDVVFWRKFPKQEERQRPGMIAVIQTSAARIRRVIITNLPANCTTKFVASIVYGGALEDIVIKPNRVAQVVFLDADHCAKYVNDNPNGLVYGKDGEKELCVFLDLHKSVDVVGGKLAEMIAKGVTRCVSVTWADLKWTTSQLWKLAGEKGRRVEGVEEEIKTVEVGSESKPCRIIMFRFCKIDDANVFYGTLSRDEDWEYCNIKYADDPCALATGVHLGT